MKRKGISPVIAVLLLIVIAVAAAILTYVWITGYIGTLQAQSGAQQVQERLKIEGVKLSGGKITHVYIRNIGEIQVEVTDIYILYTNGSIFEKPTINPTTIDAGIAKSISVTMTNTLTSGTTYIIKAVTKKGTEVTYQFTYRP